MDKPCDGQSVNLTASLARAGQAIGLLEARSEPPAGPLPGIVPPARPAQVEVSTASAMSLHSMYRAIQIHAVAASQLSLDQDGPRGAGTAVPSLLRQPSLAMSRSGWIETNVTSLATTGNAFWLPERVDGIVVDLPVLNPHEVTVIERRDKPAKYSYRGRIYQRDEMVHLALLRVPGTVVGLGPIQAARVDLKSALAVRDYAAEWFDESGVPAGTLTTDQPVTDTVATETQKRWDNTPAGRTRVLGSGLKYTPFMLKPADAQWLENQKFDVTKVARLMGVPASLMLAAVEGTNLTYTNIEQDWIAYVRFSLMAYLREIEESLTQVLPRGTGARFNVEALLRSDTKSRYEAHRAALEMGLYDLAHAQRIEGLPITPAKETA